MILNNIPPVYQCIFTVDERESCLRFSGATKAFSHLMGIRPDALGLPPEVVVPEQSATWIYQAFSFIRERNERIQDLLEIAGGLWSVSLSYNRPLLTIILSPIWDVDESTRAYSTSNLVNRPLNKVCGYFYDTILLTHTEDGYRISSVSPGFSELMDIGIGDPISKLFSYTRAHTVCADKLIDRSMFLNRISYFMDIFVRDKTPYHLLIMLIPLNHYQKNLLVGLHLLEAQEYYQMMKSVNTSPSPICEAGNIGVAVLETENGRFKRLLNTNPCFNQLVYSNKDYMFLWQHIVPVCCAKQSVLTLSHRLGKLDCLITAIPMVTPNRLFLFVMPATGPQSSIQSLADWLTKREFEIACHIVNGNSIKGIAADCGISEGTVKKNLSNIYNKLQISNRVELVRLILAGND